MRSRNGTVGSCKATTQGCRRSCGTARPRVPPQEPHGTNLQRRLLLCGGIWLLPLPRLLHLK